MAAMEKQKQFVNSSNKGLLSQISTFVAPPYPKDEYIDKEAYDYRAKTPWVTPNPPTPEDTFIADLWQLMSTVLKRENLNPKKLDVRTVMEALALYSEIIWEDLPGYRPWTHAHFVRSFSKKKQQCLAIEVINWIENYGIRDPDLNFSSDLIEILSSETPHKRDFRRIEKQVINVKGTLAGLSGTLSIGALIVVGLAIAGIFILGAAWASAKLLPWFSILTWIAFAIVIFVILPLAIPKTTRSFSSVALFIASYVFGATLWMEGLLLTLSIWGVGAVIIGLFLAGVGVVPIAMLATMTKGIWVPFIELVLLTIMTFATRIGALFLAESLEG